MTNDVRDQDGGGTATLSTSAPGLIRSIAHRLAGEPPELPVEGHDTPGAGRLQLGVQGARQEREEGDEGGEEAGECEAQRVPGAV